MKDNRTVEKYIWKRDLRKALSELAENARLVAPVEAHGETVFQEVETVQEIVFDYENCLNSPKDYVFSNDEVLFRYNRETMELEKDCGALQNVVIFGSRACDTRAVGLLDKFFSRDFKDPLYLGKRENMLIITLMCGRLGESCFCTSTHSGPYLEGAFDVQLVDIGDGYFLETASDKGRHFVETFSPLMTVADSDIRSRKEHAVNKAADYGAVQFDLEKVRAHLGESNTKEELWKDIAQRCQSCGGCLLICPTCSCFYVVDRKIDDNEGARLRNLDACYYEGLTRMSGGYNPIESREMMMKRKFYHKLWQQVDEFGESGCTGCGRCNDICPGNVNWLNVIKRIEKEVV